MGGARAQAGSFSWQFVSGWAKIMQLLAPDCRLLFYETKTSSKKQSQRQAEAEALAGFCGDLATLSTEEQALRAGRILGLSPKHAEHNQLHHQQQQQQKQWQQQAVSRRKAFTVTVSSNISPQLSPGWSTKAPGKGR